MFITKMSLPRRTFLHGVGTTLALPLLEAMVPAVTALAQTPASPKSRLGFVYVPHGQIMNQWTPAAEGAGFELTPILRPLEPYRDSLSVITNLIRPEERAQDHACTGAWLTGVAPKRTEGADFLAARTMDQIIAAKIGQETTFPSLEVATEDFTALLGACIPGFSCAYMNTLSWQSPTSPLPMEINPRVVFERMFGGESSAEQRKARLSADRSVLDLILQDLSDLERKLGPRDRVRLDEYLGNVREIERRIGRAEQQTETQLAVPAAPVGVPESFEEHATLMFDLMALAYEADHARVATYMVCREFSERTYPNLGITEPHHTVSHNNGRPAGVAQHAQINTYHMQLFAKFLERLRSTPDGDGSLYDHSTIVYGCGMADGNNHTPSPLPILVLGRGQGTGHTKGRGRHLVVAEKTPLPNFLLGLAGAFGVEMESFGISTGRLEL